MSWSDPDTLRRILSYDTWAVVGLSNDRSRAAYGVAAFLQRHGKRIVPVNPNEESVLGERCRPSLRDISIPVDVVDVFRRPEFAGSVADEAVAVGAKAVWFQLGVIDTEAYQRVRAAGLDIVMDTCPKVEWPHHGPRQAA